MIKRIINQLDKSALTTGVVVELFNYTVAPVVFS